MCSDCENRPSLGEPMGAWKAATEGGGSESPELTLGIPPFREVHLSEAGDDETELQKSVKIYSAALRKAHVRFDHEFGKNSTAQDSKYIGDNQLANEDQNSFYREPAHQLFPHNERFDGRFWDPIRSGAIRRGACATATVFRRSAEKSQLTVVYRQRPEACATRGRGEFRYRRRGAFEKRFQ